MLAIDKRLDESWSKLIKLKANMKCEFCGVEDDTLAPHHIFGRRNNFRRSCPHLSVLLDYRTNILCYNNLLLSH